MWVLSMASCGGAEQHADTEGASVPAHDAVVVVHLTNRSGHALSIVLDGQDSPLWLEVDDPPVAWNGYGLGWCEDRLTRYEPSVRVKTVAASAAEEAGLSGAQVVAAGDCWTTVPMPTGRHRARACVYDGDPPPVGPIAHPMSGAPSAWLSPPPTRCVGFAIDVVSDTTTYASVDL
jgi:hypothetical protein